MLVAVADLEPDEPGRVGAGYSPEEEAFVEAHLHDMSYIAIAAALGRTAKGVEALVRSRGWKKGYVRRGEERPRHAFVPGTPADKVLATVLMQHGRQGWAVSHAHLATVTGLAERQVRYSLQRLEAKGLIRRQRQRDGWWGDRPTIIQWLGAEIGWANPAHGSRANKSSQKVIDGP